jgi:hypothetical protein
MFSNFNKDSEIHYWTFLFHATPPRSPRSQRTDYQRQSVSIVANFAALREKCPVVWFRSGNYAVLIKLLPFLPTPETQHIKTEDHAHTPHALLCFAFFYC